MTKELLKKIITFVKPFPFLKLLITGFIFAFFLYGFKFWQQEITLRENTTFFTRLYLSNKKSFENKEKFKHLIRKFEIPYVIIDQKGLPLIWDNIYFKKLIFFNGDKIKDSDKSFRAVKEIKRNLKRFKDGSNKPLTLNRIGDESGTFKLYYGNPIYIKGLIIFIGIQISLFLILIAAIYFWRKNRALKLTSDLWVGFAKETAHQLGTPITSLMGWIEMVRLKLDRKECQVQAEKIEPILSDMDEDMRKLNKIVLRFSKIGSIPDLVPSDLNEVVKGVVKYFKERIPQKNLKIQIIANYDNLPNIQLNKDLMEWVIENLIRNSLDAIVKEEGVVEIETFYSKKEGKVRIYHKDNGKGIKRENLGKIFIPGFSTKRSGWGLGLALAKRIVTEYHSGSIFAEASNAKQGAKFVIELPVG